MEIRGIWGSVLKDERSQIINEPASHPDREAIEALSVAFVEALMRKRAKKKSQPH